MKDNKSISYLILSYYTVTHCKKFESRFMSVMDEDHEGCPAFVVTEDNLATVKKLVVPESV